MSLPMTLLPVFAMVLLSFLLMFGMARGRMGSAKTRDESVKDTAFFEIPVLFYALVAIALPLRKMDLVMVLLAWVFVVTRYAHAFITSTSSNTNQRSMTFFAGALVLLAMWIYFALDILTAAARV